MQMEKMLNQKFEPPIDNPGSGGQPRENIFHAALVEWSDASYTLDNEWRIVDADDRAVRFFGLPREELIGRDLRTLFPESRSTPFIRALESSMGDWIAGRFKGYCLHHLGFPAESYFEPNGKFLHVHSKISEAKTTLQAAQERKDGKYRRLFSKLPCAVYTCDVHGRITLYNSRAAQLWGREPRLFDEEDKFCGSHRLFDLEGERVPHEDSWMAKGLKARKPFRERRIVIEKPDGDRVIAHANVEPLFDDEGNLIGAINVLEDVTEKEKTEQALRASRLHYMNLMAILPAGLYTCDMGGVITYYNSQAVEIWGRRPEMGATDDRFCGAFKLFHLDGTPLKKEDTPMALCLQKGISFRGQEVIVERPDGSRSVLAVNIDPLVDENGERTGAINVFQDITNQKSAQEKLRESENRFHTLADNMAQLAWTCETLAEANWYNKRWYEYTGSTPEEMLGEGWKKVHHPDHIDRVLASVKRSRDSGEAWEDTFPLRGADGRYRWFLSRAIPIRDAEGRIIQWFGTNTDVTERLEAERQLAELNEHLEARVQQRTDAIEQLADQLRALAAELVRVEQRERRRLALILHDHIQQLLVAAKMQLARAGRLTDKRLSDQAIERTDEILKDALKSARSLTVELSPPILYETGFVASLSWLANHFREQHGLAVDFVVEEEVEPRTEELRLLLFEAVRELLSNTHRYSGVAEARVTLSATDDGRVLLKVEDQGCGFDVSKLEEPAAGTSFGLFSIQQRLTHFGGHLHVESSRGKGVRITLTGPPEKSHSESDRRVPRDNQTKLDWKESEKTGHEVIRVLLVDDHTIIRQGLAGLLEEEEDIEVVGEAGDAVTAIEMVRALEPDVVVMDVNMPDINGIETTRILTHEKHHSKIIGLSMHCDEDIAIAMKDAGAWSYLTKDGAATELVDAIRSCHGGAPPTGSQGV
jgi:PAS domain S-box-containing protein